MIQSLPQSPSAATHAGAKLMASHETLGDIFIFNQNPFKILSSSFFEIYSTLSLSIVTPLCKRTLQCFSPNCNCNPLANLSLCVPLLPLPSHQYPQLYSQLTSSTFSDSNSTEIMKYLSFCAWLVLLSIMSLRFVHVVAFFYVTD
jgi:hypothetical protein